MVQFENLRTLQIHFSRAFPEEKPLSEPFYQRANQNPTRNPSNAVQPMRMSLQIESIEFQWVLMESLE